MEPMLDPDLQRDVDRVGRIDAVPRILDVVCRMTGMRFAAVARVTDTRWICCASQDGLGFGLGPGGELELLTTICHEIRQCGRAVTIDDVQADPHWRDHHTPAQYGFRSYISLPIRRADGSFFGTLCAIDPEPVNLHASGAIGMFELFAQLIGEHLDTTDRLQATESALLDARRATRLREQFMAVLGHDLRNPLQTLTVVSSVLDKEPERGATMVPLMQRSVRRMSELVENLLDFAKSQLGEGMQLAPVQVVDLAEDLRHVVDELTITGRAVDYSASLQVPVACDRRRVAQLLSNLLANAIRHGDPFGPVRVQARSDPSRFELSVSNAGPAIPSDVRDRLFQPFIRSREQGQSREGLGLGLFIVSEIARAHGGSMHVDSDDALTRFTFRMPQPAAPAA